MEPDFIMKVYGGFKANLRESFSSQEVYVSHLFYNLPNSEVKALLVKTKQRQPNKNNNNTKTSLGGYGGI